MKQKDTIKAAVEFIKAWAEGVYRRVIVYKQPLQDTGTTTPANLRMHRMEGWPRLKNNPPALESLAKITVPELIILEDNDLTYIAVSLKYLAGEISSAKLVS